MTLATWEADFRRYVEEWRSLGLGRRPTVSLSEWEPRFEQYRDEQRRLRRAGQWVSGPADLMHVARVADDELTHSNVVAWLLNPAGRHGLGDRLLAALMDEGWRGMRTPDTDSAVVEREVERGARIADIVVYMGATTLVIENKVWSDESAAQCEDLYQLWLDPARDVRFLLLTLDGHPPLETHSRAAADAWRGLSYASLGRWLWEQLPTVPPSLARRTVEQYVETLRITCRGLHRFEVSVGGGNVDD